MGAFDFLKFNRHSLGLDSSHAGRYLKGALPGLLTGDPISAIGGAYDAYSSGKQADALREQANREEEMRKRALSENLAMARNVQSRRGIKGSTLGDIQLQEIVENTGQLTSPLRYQADILERHPMGNALGLIIQDIYRNRRLKRYGTPEQQAIAQQRQTNLKNRLRLPTRGVFGFLGRTLG